VMIAGELTIVVPFAQKGGFRRLELDTAW